MLLLPCLLAGLLPLPALAALWPAPKTMTNGTSFLRLSPHFTITLSPSLKSTSSRISASLASAIATASYQLKHDRLERLVPGRGVYQANKIHAAKELTSLTLSFSAEDGPSGKRGETQLWTIEESVDQPVEEWDEAYALNVPLGGEATLTASSSLGLLRGLQSFTLLWYTLASDGTIYAVDMPIKVTDEPSFPWRGLLLDTSRNYYPVDVIMRTLRAMSYTKLNVFNWHVTDTQSWPLVVPAYPNISALAAYSAAQVYTPDNVKDIQNYAKSLGITVVIEIDTPGHTGSIHPAFPDYVACYEAHPWTHFANEPPSGQIRFPVPAVQAFMNKLLASVLQNVQGSYWSTGGDELNTNCYAEDPASRAALKAANETLEQALTKFVLSEHATVHKAGKSPVVWEEMALDHEVGKSLSNDTVILVWLSSANARAVADMGLKLVHVPSNYFYLDCGAGEWIGNTASGKSWCDPFKSWQWIYGFEPYANITEEEKPLVLGGQTALWSEQADQNNIDTMVWPRAASAAELFWTGPKLPNGQKRHVQEAIVRLHDWRYRVNNRGINAIALQPEWCALRPHKCNIGS